LILEGIPLDTDITFTEGIMYPVSSNYWSSMCFSMTWGQLHPSFTSSVSRFSFTKDSSKSKGIF